MKIHRSLSLDEAVTCARDRIKHQPGGFTLIGNSIAYSYESENGAARVIVIFDEERSTSPQGLRRVRGCKDRTTGAAPRA